MATYTVHPPHIYDPHTNGPSSQDYYTPYDDDDDTLYPCSQYYPPYLVGVDQAPYTSAGSHPLLYPGDANHPAVTATPYPTEHDSQSSSSSTSSTRQPEWFQHNHNHHPHLQARSFYTRQFYEPGEVSPVSDDSSAGTFYESPQPYEHVQLVDAYNTNNNSNSSNYYPVDPPRSVVSDGYNPTTAYDSYGQLSPVLDDTSEGGSEPFPTYTHDGYCNNTLLDPHSQLFSIDVDSTPTELRHQQQRCYPPPHYQHAPPAHPTTTSYRSDSPMGHLPYHHQEQDRYGGTTGMAEVVEDSRRSPSSSPFESSSSIRGIRGIGSIERPQPRYPIADSRSLQLLFTTQQHQQQHPTPILIPAPRSPPVVGVVVVEDTPKKPLTLACLFCRKRKIACGSPAPGKKDRTCNQCARRNLQCVYPVNSRRGTRQRELEALSSSYPS